MVFFNILKAAVITILGFATVGVATWGLIAKDINADGITMAIAGLGAYVIVWIIGLFIIGSSSPA
jgi:hypothetical protein